MAGLGDALAYIAAGTANAVGTDMVAQALENRCHMLWSSRTVIYP